ncbi:MAG TPA: prevent-host-death protein [Gammaproteobacteria bacterium]|nr:prevent-host-death protein [Gammaproteobacteria bacterium]
MNTIPALEIKRRGISIVDDQIESGPVHVIKNNRPQYVVMSEDRYQAMIDDMNQARELCIKASLEEAVAGQTRQGSAEALIREIFSAD